jgi:predicted enzyme related to lactoylglutathione lyase
MDRLVAVVGRPGRVQRYLYVSHGATEPVAGTCHSRGGNAGLPPVWLVYITVADLDASIARCQSLGGKILRPPESMGPKARLCVIQDPAGRRGCAVRAGRWVELATPSASSFSLAIRPV